MLGQNTQLLFGALDCKSEQFLVELVNTVQNHVFIPLYLIWLLQKSPKTSFQSHAEPNVATAVW